VYGEYHNWDYFFEIRKLGCSYEQKIFKLYF
jgi:hypothetical protein